MFKAERIDPAIRERVWVLPKKPGSTGWDGVFQLSGAAIVEDETGDTWLEPGFFFLSRARSDRKLRVQAGGECIHFMASEQVIAAAVGRSPEAMDLRRLLEAPIALRLDNAGRDRALVEGAVNLLLEESGIDAVGAGTMVEAGLKIILISLLRGLAETGRAPKRPDRSSWRLQQFRQLMESHFRERWPVGQYADAMGIGPDRLHDLCARKLNRPPKDLIQERGTYEAQTMLTNTTLSVSEISARMGFKDPSHFGKHFTRCVGTAPGKFRKRQAARGKEEKAEALDYADWP